MARSRTPRSPRCGALCALLLAAAAASRGGGDGGACADPQAAARSALFGDAGDGGLVLRDERGLLQVPRRSEESGGEAPITVLSWNLLARRYSKYEAAYHRNPDGKLETEEQTRVRHEMSAALIQAESPSVVLLQECEPEFFVRNPAGARLLLRYHFAPCFVDGSPGTAVLLRKDSLRWDAASHKCIGGTDEQGGPSKVCSVGRFRDAVGQEWKVAGCHFTWDGAAELRREHVELLAPELEGAERVLVGGDWNAEAASIDKLQKATWLRQLSRLRLHAPDGTCLSSAGGELHKEHIDHLFVSRGVRAADARALLTPRSPYGEGAPAEIVVASDHVPVGALLYG